MISAPLSTFAGEPTAALKTINGDVLEMPDSATTVSRLPRNGMDKATVERRYGTPVRKDSPVGDPPISVWYYDDFKVFFEYQLVLHSVSEARKPTVYTNQTK